MKCPLWAAPRYACPVNCAWNSAGKTTWSEDTHTNYIDVDLPDVRPVTRENRRTMRATLRKFAVAMMLTAIAGVAGLTAAGTAAPANAATSCSAGDGIKGSFQIENEQSGYYAIKPSGSGGVSKTDTFFNDVNSVDPTYFCSEDGVSVGGTMYYYYNDNSSKCLTVDANASPQYTYEAACGKYPASQQWHWIYNGTEHDGTLKNNDTGECLWFTGFNASTGRESDINPINVGGCTRNENNTIIQGG
jgi:hypothetical protein